MWTGLTAKSLKALTSLKSYPKTPTANYIIDQFSTPKDQGLKYGQRLHGYFVPPETGNYIFAASCTDECKLYLSKSDDESKKDVIITHDAGSVQDQSSDPVLMKGGHTYFIEALSYHDAEDSPMKVGVRLPSGKILAPIPAQYLKLERGAMVDEEFDELPSASIRSLLAEATFPASPSKWQSLPEFNMQEYEADGNHGHRISGYFFARETGKYKFFGTCPNGCRLYLSDDDTCNKRTLVLEYNSPFNNPTARSIVTSNATSAAARNDTSSEVVHDDNQANITTRNLDLPSLFEVSKTFELNAGLYYYIEALQASRGNQLNSVKIGVVQPSGKTYYPIKKDLLKQFTPSKHGVVRELWKNVKGENLRDLTVTMNYPSLPSEVDLLSDFDAPANERYNYGQRLKGYFVAPMTGDYRFVMACDRKCEFYMSSTEKPEHKKRMLRLTKKTSKHQFDKYPEEQLSQPIHLDIGQQYYIEAIHKAATGLDHLSLGVTLPTGTNEWPVPKKYLRFRPKEKISSPVTVPCNYNLDDPNPSAKTVSTLINNPKFGLDGTNVERTSQNDIAILGEEESSESDENNLSQNENKIQPAQSMSSFFAQRKPFSESAAERLQSNENFDENEASSQASAKVKVTRLELPFGTGDSKSAAEALKVMKKINKEDKDKLRLQKNAKGKGFTLTGLPADLNTNEVTKIAKGVASVIEADKMEGGSGEEAKVEGTGEEIQIPAAKFKEEVSIKNKKKKPANKGAAAALDLANSGVQLAGALAIKQNGGAMQPTIIGGPKLNQMNVPQITAAQLDIESVNVVGNLADAAKTGDMDLLKNPTTAAAAAPQHNKPAATYQQNQNVLFSTSQKQPTAAHNGGLQSSLIGGDSIGAPVSDIMPGLNGLLVAPPTTNQQNGGSGGGDSHSVQSSSNAHYASQEPAVQETPTQQNSNSDSTLAINHLTDFDILDVDLEGLKSMKKTGAPEGSSIAKFMGDSDIPAGFEDASFVGDRLNTEANEFSNLMTLKKKKIPKTKPTPASASNNKIDLMKKSQVIAPKRKTLVKRSLTGKSIVVRAKSSVAVSFKHENSTKQKP